MKVGTAWTIAVVLAAFALAVRAETHVYQAQVTKLMHMIIHSMYTNKEVFLRELLANSSDALDKRRLASLQGGSKPADDLKIRVYADKEASQLIVEDNGIGMTKEDLVEYLGTIAKSGTGDLLKKLQY